MGYSVTFAPPLDFVADYAPINDMQAESDLLWSKKVKIDILVVCLNNETCDGEFSVYSLYDKLKCEIDLLRRVTTNICRSNIYNDIKESGSVTFSGYKYENLSNKPDIDEIEYHLIDELVLLTKTVKTDGYFDDNSNYFRKKNEISDLLLDFEDEVYSCCIFESMEHMKDYVGSCDDN